MLVEHEGRSPRVDPGARVAVGDPAQVLGPDRHEEIWAVQRELHFPGAVLGTERGASAAEASRRDAELFGRHRDDAVVG